MNLLLAIITVFQMNVGVSDDMGFVEQLNQSYNEVTCLEYGNTQSCVSHCEWLEKYGVDLKDNEAVVCEDLQVMGIL